MVKLDFVFKIYEFKKAGFIVHVLDMEVIAACMFPSVARGGFQCL